MLRDVIPETRITHFDGEVEPCYWLGSSGRNPDMAVTCDRVYITFNGYDQTEGASDIYLVILSVPSCAPPVGGVIVPIAEPQLNPITGNIVLIALAISILVATLVGITKINKRI